MRPVVLALFGLDLALCHGQGLRAIRKRLQLTGGPYSSTAVGWNVTSSSSSSFSSSSSPSSSPSSSGVASTLPYSSQNYTYSPSSVASGTAPGYPSSQGTASSAYSSTSRPNGTGYSSLPGPTSSGPSSSYDSASTRTYKPTGYVPSNSSSLACGGKTLNVLDASLDWWYTRTLYNVVSTISIQYNGNDTRTGWTVLPATTPFDITSALATPTCTSLLTYNTYYNSSLWDVVCTTAPTPVAADTTVISQTAHSDITATTGTGPIPDVVATPPPASISVPDSTGAYSEGTAFVYFSAYEVVTKSQTQYANGNVGCAKATNTYTMAEPFSFEYADGNVNGTKAVGVGVVGDVAPAFLKVVGVKNAIAGSWVAAPTVALVVQNVFAAEAVLAAANGPLLTTQVTLLTPEPTLPSGFTPMPDGSTPNFAPTIGFTGRIESTAPSLAVPTSPPPGRPGGGPPTNRPPGPGSGKPTNGGSPTNGQPGRPTTTPGGVVGPIVSVIISALKPTTPTNAVQVLSQALQTTEHHDPTAAAIVSGVSGPNPSRPAGNLPGGSPNNPSEGVPIQSNGIGPGPNGTPIIVVGGTTFTADSQTRFSLNPTATLTPGGRVVVHGTTLSLAPGLTAVVVNGQTLTASPSLITPAPVITIGGSTYAPTGGSTYNIAGETLTPGGIITVDGTTVSLASGASTIVVNGVTQNLMTVVPASITAPPTLTIGGSTFTAINNGDTYIIDSQTLTPGEIETVTVGGTTYIISLGPSATVLVIETVGSNGEVTATMTETLYTSPGSQATITSVVGASATAGSQPSSGPSRSVALSNGAASLTFSGIGISLGILALAIWL